MLSHILALFDDEHDDNEDYCEDCEAITYDPDIGYWSCPAEGNPYDSCCIRCNKQIEWSCLKNEAEDFLRNIRGLW